MPTGFDVDTLAPSNISTTAADFGAEMADFDGNTHDAAFVQFEIDTDSSFPDPTLLSDTADIGLVAQAAPDNKREDGLQADTSYFVRAQAENVVYDDDTLFSTAAKESSGFINDISNKDISNAIQFSLPNEAMANFDEAASNVLKDSTVVSNFWSLDQATANFWDSGSFTGDSTSGFWSRNLDLSNASDLVLELNGSLPVSPYETLQVEQSEPSGRPPDFAETNDYYMAVDDSGGNLHIYNKSDDTLAETKDMGSGASLSVSANETYIAASMDDQVYIYNTSDLTQNTSFSVSDAFQIPNLEFSPDGSDLAVQKDTVVEIFDTSDFSSKQTLSDVSVNGTEALDYTQNYIVVGGTQSAGDPSDAYIYDPSDYSLIETISESTGIVSAEFNPDESFLALGLENSSGDVNVYNTSDWSLNTGLSLGDVIYDLTFTSRYLATVGFADYMRIWSTSDFSKITDKQIIEFSRTYGVYIPESEQFMYVGTADETLRRYTGSGSGPPTEVNVDGTNLFSEEIATDNFVERTIDVSGVSSFTDLEIGLSGDISPDTFQNTFRSGPTGSGNAYTIYSSSGTADSSSIEVEIADLRLE